MMKDYNNTRELLIPVLKPYKLKVMVQPNGETHVFYGITNEQDTSMALGFMAKYIVDNLLGEGCAAFDFRNDTRIGNCHWFTEDELNVYENTKCTEMTSLLIGNKGSYERVYWFIQDGK